MRCLPLAWWLLAALALGWPGAAPSAAQDFKPGAIKPPTPEVLKQIAAKTKALDTEITLLRNKGLLDPIRAELEVFHQAAVKIVQHQEFYHADSGAWTLDVLDRGLERAAKVNAKKGATPADLDWFTTPGRTAARAYRSQIDGSVQPFAVTLPPDYGVDPQKKWRIDVVLHGRDGTLTEVKFLRAHDNKPAPKDLHHIKIDIFGRGNNAYRWAGEMDVIEAMTEFMATELDLQRLNLVDRSRWVLRGFSMGGAGTWHLGLHRPDTWCVIGPGAGFTTTHGYIAKLPAKLADHQERCLRIYDALDYAENAFNVPVVAYSGSEDGQKKAADNIEARLAQLGLAAHMKHIVAPGLEHKFPPEWQKKAEAQYAVHANKGRDKYPPRVRFVTYTLKYPGCDWVHIMRLGRHYDRALVDATKTEDGFKVTTENVRTLKLDVPPKELQDMTVVIDKQEVNARPWGNKGGKHAVYLQKRDGKWTAVMPERLEVLRAQQPHKAAGLQGPIDDAFTDGFVCVRGTGQPWHAATQKYAEADLDRFRKEWAKFLRGTLPIKDDADVTRDDIANKHLILFGDPASNSLLAQVLDGLPLQWTKDTIAFAGQKVKAGEHVPVLIYPNPLNAARYVVVNSGHTFHAAEFQGTNAQLYPRLGDYALLRLNAGKDALAADVVTAGLFDEEWRVEKR